MIDRSSLQLKSTLLVANENKSTFKVFEDVFCILSTVAYDGI